MMRYSLSQYELRGEDWKTFRIAALLCVVVLLSMSMAAVQAWSAEPTTRDHRTQKAEPTTTTTGSQKQQGRVITDDDFNAQTLIADPSTKKSRDHRTQKAEPTRRNEVIRVKIKITHVAVDRTDETIDITLNKKLARGFKVKLGKVEITQWCTPFIDKGGKQQIDCNLSGTRVLRPAGDQVLTVVNFVKCDGETTTQNDIDRKVSVKRETSRLVLDDDTDKLQ